ncbi:MAG TPA: SGNH/GDSL hydrolase family protein [Edaphobacter sp.]|nr:SGNH/GDSL hydrolase family protein [Edaphobacter sp.]
MLVSLCAIVFALLIPIRSVAAMKVINRGIPGQTTAEIDARTEVELNRYNPDVVVLFAGMNDAVNDRKFLSPASSRAHLESVIRKCRQQGSRVVLVTVHQPDITRLMQRHKPEAYGDRPPQQRIRELNAEILSVAAQNDLPVVDFASLLKERGGPTTEWSTDGVHLTAKGYALLAQAVFKQLQRLGDIQTVLCLGDSLTFGIGVRKPESPETSETYPGKLSSLAAKSVEDSVGGIAHQSPS